MIDGCDDRSEKPVSERTGNTHMPSVIRPFTSVAFAALLAFGPMHAADGSEQALIAAAQQPGPDQARALSSLGAQRPEDPVSVAKVLVDGVLSKDVLCRINAGQALRSLLTSVEDDVSFRAAMATHAERLLAGAEAGMADRINPALEALSAIQTPSGAMTPRLIALLAPGANFRRYTLGALARSRPLTPEIKRAVLAESTGSPLVQQDVVIAIQTWPEADLLGEDVDRALVVLFDAVMGNVPPRIVDILKQRGRPSPIVAARLQEILAHPATSDERFRDALAGYAASAADGEEMALLGRLLAGDPRLDPDRAGCVLRHLERRQGLPPGLLARLAELVQDTKQSWWLRHNAARLLAGSEVPAGIAALVTELGERPAWIIEVDSAPGWPAESVDSGLAKASGDEERSAWTLAKRLKTELEAREQEPDFNQRRGAFQVACVAGFAAAHPEAAWKPFTVCRMLEGFAGNHKPTPVERAQCIDYVGRLIKSGFFNEASIAGMRYPQGGPSEMARRVCDALNGAYRPERRSPKSKDASAQPLHVARLETARNLHAAKAPPALLLRADRELAAEIRSRVREERPDPAVYRELLTGCGFSLMPVPVFVAELEALARPGGR